MVVLLVAYLYLVAVGVVALVLVGFAQFRADSSQTSGRLAATNFTLAGLIVASLGRVGNAFPMIIGGVLSINIGITLFVLYLPDNGLLQLLAQRRRKDPGGDA